MARPAARQLLLRARYINTDASRLPSDLRTAWEVGVEYATLPALWVMSRLLWTKQRWRSASLKTFPRAAVSPGAPSLAVSSGLVL